VIGLQTVVLRFTPRKPEVRGPRSPDQTGSVLVGVLYIQHMVASSSHALAREIAEDCLASRARRLTRTLTRAYDQALRGQGVTGAQLGMLVAIALAGPTTAAWVGRRLDLERSTVSRNLGRLVAAGLVTTDDDGLRVTERGAATIRLCHPLWRRAQQEVTSSLEPRALRLLASVRSPSTEPKAKAKGQGERHGKR
jgi:DNA-binding MarR family transcriptional regulator